MTDFFNTPHPFSRNDDLSGFLPTGCTVKRTIAVDDHKVVNLIQHVGGHFGFDRSFIRGPQQLECQSVKGTWFDARQNDNGTKLQAASLNTESGIKGDGFSKGLGVIAHIPQIPSSCH